MKVNGMVFKDSHQMHVLPTKLVQILNIVEVNILFAHVHWQQGHNCYALMLFFRLHSLLSLALNSKQNTLSLSPSRYLFVAI